MDLPDAAEETELSFESDISDQELAESMFKARQSRQHKDFYGRRGGLVAIELPPAMNQPEE